MDLAALIAKLESASEGSLALDREIAAATGWVSDRDKDLGFPPPYSRSLDVALSLVPEGHSHAMKSINVEGAMDCSAQINWQRPSYAPTLALALVIAALKASQASSQAPQS